MAKLFFPVSGGINCEGRFILLGSFLLLGPSIGVHLINLKIASLCVIIKVNTV